MFISKWESLEFFGCQKPNEFMLSSLHNKDSSGYIKYISFTNTQLEATWVLSFPICKFLNENSFFM